MPTDPNMLAITARSVSSLPPDASVAIASTSPDTPTAVNTAQSMTAYGTATQQVNYLKQRSQDEQDSMWAQATDSQRAMWSGAGYKPPSAGGGRNIFSRAIHDVLGAPSALYRQAEQIPYVGGALQGVGSAVGAIGNALGSGTRLTAHLYRTGEMENIVGNNPNNPVANLLQGLGGYLLNPTAWADAWHQTTRGDQTFNPNTDRDIQSTSGLNSDEIGLAKAAAGSQEDIQNYLQSKLNSGMTTPQVTDLQQKLNDPEFQKVVSQYKDAKLSFGRSLVPTWLWNHAHPLATVISGIGDGAYSFFDPLLIAGKVAKVFRVSAYAFGSLDELATKLDSPGFQKYAENIAKYTAADDVDGLAKAHPELRPVIPFLAQRQPQTAEEVTQLAKPDLAAADQVKQTQERAQFWQDANDWADQMGEAVSPETKAFLQNHLNIMNQKTADAVKQFVTNNTLALHIAGGGAFTAPNGIPEIPHLSVVGQQLNNVKNAMRNTIDWAKDFSFDPGPNGAVDLAGNVVSKPVNFVGDFLKRATTIATPAGPFDLNDPKSFTKIEQFLNIAVPADTRATLMHLFATAPDEGARKSAWTTIYQQVLKSAGVPESSDLYKRNTVDTASNLGNQMYSVAGNDFMDNGNGTFTPAGLLAKHANSIAYMPGVNEIYANAQRGAALKALYNLPNNPFFDWFMTRWKKFSLARPGFGVRMAEDEIANSGLRNGFIPMIKAQLANRIAGDSVVGPFADLNPIEHGVSVLARELGERNLVDSDTLESLQGKVLANRTKQFFTNIGMKSEKVQDYISTMQKYPELFDGALPQEISAVHGMSRNYAGSLQDDIENIQDGMAKNAFSPTPRLAVRTSGKWIPYQSGAPGHTGMWMARLDELANDRFTRPVLADLGTLPDDQLTKKLADNLMKSENDDIFSRMTRGQRTSDFRVAGQQATKQDLANDWASHLLMHIKSFLYEHDADGNPTQPIEGFAQQMAKTGQAPTMKQLLSVPMESRPPVTYGPEFVHLPFGGKEGVISEFATNLLQRMGQATNVVSRHPQYLDAVTKGDKAFRPVIEQLLGTGTPAAEEVLQTLVHNHAVEAIAPFIHRPEFRSQLNVLLTNLLPFQFAQEQFWKRWGKLFVHSPEAFRMAQLAHHSLGATGITTTDDQGNETFNYPASGFVQKALADTFGHLGIPVTLPIKQAFSGQLKMVAPGLDRSFAPSFGPLVSVPLNALDHVFPELHKATSQVLGPIATDRPYWEQVVPASLTRFVNAFTANPNTSASYANAMMKTIQDLAANGKLPQGGFDEQGNPLPMTPEQRQLLLRRVSNGTRIQFLVRAMLGLTAPAAPQLAIGDTKIGKEINMLASLKGMNLSQALQEISNQNPDATPYEVFLSEGTGSETLPATQASLDLLDKNEAFFAAHPEASGFLLPQYSQNDKFNDEAYKEQLAFGLRNRRTPSDFLDQLDYAQAARTYYANRDNYQATVKNLKGASKAQLDNNYQQWKANFLQTHPVFADMLQSATAVTKRNSTMGQLIVALNDPRAPENAQTEQIRTLIDTYQDYQNYLSQYAGMNSHIAAQARKSATANFAAWAQAHVVAPGADLPGALDVYNRLIRPEVEPNV